MIEYEVKNYGDFKIGEKTYPDWRVEQIIDGQVERSFESGTKAEAQRNKRYLERTAGLEFFMD